MSTLAVTGNALGTGVVTLTSPNTNTNQTISLPDATATVLSIDGSGNVNNTSGTVNLGSGQVVKDSSGNLGIGTSSPSKKFVVSNAGAAGLELDPFTRSATTGAALLAYNRSGAAFVRMDYDAEQHLFFTSTTERARIDNSGNLLVGSATQGASARLYSQTTSANADSPPIYAVNTSTSSSGVTAVTTSLGGSASAANTNCYHIRAITQGSAVYYLYGNGTSSFSSDQRLKKSIEPARDGYINDLCKLRVVKYQWAGNADDSQKELGLIAQEVEQVFPGLVQATNETIAGVENTKVLKYSVLPIMLLKAIQEQQAMIEELRAEVAALKAKA